MDSTAGQTGRFIMHTYMAFICTFFLPLRILSFFCCCCCCLCCRCRSNVNPSSSMRSSSCPICCWADDDGADDSQLLLPRTKGYSGGRYFIQASIEDLKTEAGNLSPHLAVGIRNPAGAAAARPLSRGHVVCLGGRLHVCRKSERAPRTS